MDKVTETVPTCGRCGHPWDTHYTAAPPPDGGRCMASGTNGEPACTCEKFVRVMPEGTYR